MEYCYIAREKCGCITGVAVDNLEHPKRTASDVAEFIKSNRTIERMSVEQFKSQKFGCSCKDKEA